MIRIKPHKIKPCQVNVPGSKSYTHRVLIAAALADGVSHLKNVLISEDTRYTIEALKQMGIQIEVNDMDVRVEGKGGRLESSAAPIYLGNSGTSMRLLTGVAALTGGVARVTL